MKPEAILINGPVVDEKALVQALEEGRIAGASLDGYEKEPEVEPALIGGKSCLSGSYCECLSSDRTVDG